MQLSPGTRLGPYEIVAPAGAGGMGEVYRARDTRLGRSVAIKVLTDAFAGDAHRRLRFEREARAISALNHPNICTLHDVGREGGVDYLVLEFCEGQTLAQRIARGPLPIDEAVRHGIAIATALSRAHRAGIVHRDLKPSNVMLTKSGLKLLDFGIARQDTGGLSTETRTLERGVIVGTPRYMAPEVLRGVEADARSDIFALGLILEEMITGKPAAILDGDRQPLTNVPPALEHVIATCLAKSPDERWESAHDVAEQLRWIAAEPADEPRRRNAWPFIAGALALIALAAIAVRVFTRAPERRVLRLSIPLEGNVGINIHAGAPEIAISPDGKRVAYFVDEKLYLRDLDSFATVRLGAQGVSPSFSSDGAWIVYYGPGGWAKVPVGGGEPQLFAQPIRGTPRGATWAPDGTAYCAPAPSGGLWRMDSREARQITVPNVAAGETSHRFPSMLPDGRHLLFTIRTNQIASFDDAKIAVLSLDTGKWKVVLEGGTCARYADGQLFYARTGALYAVPFDAGALAVGGPARKVVDGVTMLPSTGGAHYDVSRDGDLVYAPGRGLDQPMRLLTVDRAGTILRSVTFPQVFDAGSPLALAPDERRFAFSSAAANNDIWIYDLETARATRFSFEPGDEFGQVWMPDGTRIIYSAGGPDRLVMRNVNGSGPAVELLRSAAAAQTISPDGKQLVFTERGDKASADLWLMSLDDRTRRPLLRTPFNEFRAAFSPDARWLAYCSNQTGKMQAYVHSMAGDGEWQVSIDGAQGTGWSADGKEILFSDRYDFFAVPFSVAGKELRPGKPRKLFTIPGAESGVMMKNGNFLIMQDAPDLRPTQLNIVLGATR